MIGGILTLLTSGLEAYKQHKQNKANALKRQDEFEQEKHNKNLVTGHAVWIKLWLSATADLHR